MKSHSIVITDADMDCLTSMIRDLQHSRFRDCQQLDVLEQTLQTADVRPPNRIPKSVIGMNSSVRLREVETQTEQVYTLVLPHRSNASRGFISILTPVGIAIIGHKKGDIVQVRAPRGSRNFRIEQVIHDTGSGAHANRATDHRVGVPNFTAETEIAA